MGAQQAAGSAPLRLLEMMLSPRVLTRVGMVKSAVGQQVLGPDQLPWLLSMPGRLHWVWYGSLEEEGEENEQQVVWVGFD